MVTAIALENAANKVQMDEFAAVMAQTQLLIGTPTPSLSAKTALALSLDELQLKSKESYWKDLKALAISEMASIDSYLKDRPQTDENYQDYKDANAKFGETWAKANANWSVHCQDLERSQLGINEYKGQTDALTQANRIGLQLAQNDWKARCQVSLSNITSWRFKIDEVDQVVDRLLSARIQKLIHP